VEDLLVQGANLAVAFPVVAYPAVALVAYLVVASWDPDVLHLASLNHLAFDALALLVPSVPQEAVDPE
jgi:hypothetical protein